MRHGTHIDDLGMLLSVEMTAANMYSLCQSICDSHRLGKGAYNLPHVNEHS